MAMNSPSPSPTPPSSCSSSGFQGPHHFEAEYFTVPMSHPTNIDSEASSDRDDTEEDGSSTSELSPSTSVSQPSSSASSYYAIDDLSPNHSGISSCLSATPSTSPPSSLYPSRRSSQDDLLAHLDFAHSILAAEARAVLLASERLRTNAVTRAGFASAIRTVLNRVGVAESFHAMTSSQPSTSSAPLKTGKVIWTGVGKSGLIARKLSATLASLGVTSIFLHPVEALHGDLGLVTPGQDVVIALSHSGSSAEILTLLPHIVARRVPIIAFTARRDSKLAQLSSAWIDCRTASVPGRGADGKRRQGEQQDTDSDSDSQQQQQPPTTHPDELKEAPPSHLPAAPTSSTSVALAMGDSFVLAIANALQLGVPAFKLNHPGGALGDALAKVQIAPQLGSFDFTDLR